MSKRWFDKDLKEALKMLEDARDLICDAKEIIENLKDEQQEKMDNMPESLQDTDRYYKMEERLNNFDEFWDKLEDIDVNEIGDLISDMEDIE